ncbi:hypothetical protein PQX77_011462 [Marasmius sp. AFHP31]|nr:hypothetical protein PQX77_011462 [Marasmius sp. AFHP31]
MPSEPDSEALLSLIAPHLPRVRTFRTTFPRFRRLWKIPDPAELQPTTSKLYNLVALDIVQGWSNQDDGDRSGIIEALQRAPALERVRCSALIFNRYNMFLHRNIRTLAISCFVFGSSFDPQPLAELRKLQNLRTLSLALTGGLGQGRSTIPELASSTLETLRIKMYEQSSVYRTWFETLILPSLVTLDLVARNGIPGSLYNSLPQLQSLRNLSISTQISNPASIIYLLHSFPILESFRIVETLASHYRVQPQTFIETFLAELTSSTVGTSSGAFLPNLKSFYIWEITPPLSYYHKEVMELLLSTLEANSTRELTEVRLVFDESPAMTDRAIPLRSSRLSTLILLRSLLPRFETLESKGTKCGVFRCNDGWRWTRVLGSLERDDFRWRLQEFDEDED